jgi:hypothetical protein
MFGLSRSLIRSLSLFVIVLAAMGRTAAYAQTTWSIPASAPLLTSWASDVSPSNALVEYPRPQMTRERWQNLNGLWQYAIAPINADAPPLQFDGQILVPFPIESALSGVMKPLLPNERLWYRRTFTVPESWAGQTVLLHFGACDWETRVLINGKDIGSHRGGYDEFSYDITDVLKTGENEIMVDVDDPTDTGWQLRGKQVLHPGGAAYTATSGIWQTAWIEPVPADHVETLKIVTDGIHGVIHLTVRARITPSPTPFRVEVLDGTKIVATGSGVLGSQLTAADMADLRWYKATSEWDEGTVDLTIPQPHLWSSDYPFLYNISVSILGTDGNPIDTVGSYAGIRTLAIGMDSKGNLRLYVNGKMTMLPMVLDQGFWPDGIYTAPTDDALKFDLQAEKSLGVAVRKHVKIEPDRWYYWADKLGVMVLQDMPTGDEGDAATDRPTSPEAAAQCQEEMGRLIEQRWNHPSIISWNMFNEGWGQHDTVATANWAKQLDPTRLIDEASGFPWHGAGDICDCHGGIPPKSDGQISIDTEDGSVGVSSPGHDWPIGSLWTPLTYDPATGGPVTAKGELYPFSTETKKWMTKWVRRMFKSLWANTDNTGQTGDSYCQITDVETEEDGLISYDRKLWKVDPDPIRMAAEGKDPNANAAIIIPTALTEPTTWKYTDRDPGNGWYLPRFNDTSWRSGKSAFGAGYDHIGTPWTETPGDIWLRKDFTLTSLPKAPFLRLIHDEDFEIYINGVEASHGSGFIGSYDDFDMSLSSIAALKTGKNIIAVHCRQTTGGQIIDLGLMDGK